MSFDCSKQENKKLPDGRCAKDGDVASTTFELTTVNSTTTHTQQVKVTAQVAALPSCKHVKDKIAINGKRAIDLQTGARVLNHRW